MIRLRIDLAYDGTNFHGWAKQPGFRTVQGVIEATMTRLLRIQAGEQLPRLVVAGRTDTGVHARHQVCHVDIENHILDRAIGHMDLNAPDALCHRLRRVLPTDIAIYCVLPAPEGFDARFSALERSYVYRICDTWDGRDPRTKNYVLQLDSPLNFEKLQSTASMIVGLRDFGSFATPSPGGTTIRDVKVAHWVKKVGVPTSDGFDTYGVKKIGVGSLEFLIVADAFARNMVRSLVGAQVQVALGNHSLDWFAQKINEPRREGATGPISPIGLSLEHVSYPPDELLGERAQAIRAKRRLAD